MKLGVDLSILDELEEFNPSFYYKKEKIEPFSFFKNHSGIDIVRLRLWVNPFDEEGNPYGGGTNDINAFLRLAKRAKENNMSVLLDFHFSDFYVDPSRQRLPKKWKDKSYKEVLSSLEEYVINTLSIIKKENIDIKAIQIGNEISNGVLFPYGELDKEYTEENGGGFKGLASLLQVASSSSRKIYPNAKIIVHLEHSASKDMQEWFFSNLTQYFNDFDVIGESYYPYWHGGLPLLIDNLTHLKEKYRKDIWLVEIGYEWGESLLPNHHHEFANRTEEEFRPNNINGRIPYPISQDGQVNYLKHLLKIAKEVGVSYVFYWEPCWVLAKGNGWAKEAGQIYCGLTPSKAENDWANETLFDFSGNATKAIDIFTNEFVSKL